MRSARMSVSTLPPARPVATRLEADDRFAGRGVTIAFLDSGFYAHPDLTATRHRIRAYHDVVSNLTLSRSVPPPDVSSWHGMMTSVVCAGDGSLSGGRYKGLAHESDVVLVKVGSSSRIEHDAIRRGLDWIIANKEKYKVGVINISCGGDYEASYLHDALSQSAEECVREGIVVVAAAGNANSRGHRVVPPASSPSVISVGGLDDAKDLQPGRMGLYYGSYGPTIDGLQKPEVIAPAIWVAAPILPGTETAQQASLISDLTRAENADEMRSILQINAGVDAELDAVREASDTLIRNLTTLKRRDQKVIDQHYKHVDGTSFAAPIVTSVVAQMLEACPDIKPHEVKRALIDSAQRIPDVSSDLQGWGVVQPRAAVERAMLLGTRR